MACIVVVVAVRLGSCAIVSSHLQLPVCTRGAKLNLHKCQVLDSESLPSSVVSPRPLTDLLSSLAG